MAMKLLTLLSILSITISIVAAASSADHTKKDSTVESYIRLPESKETTSSDGSSDHDFLLPRPHMTCNIFPQVCRRMSSSGPDCCRNKCTDVMNDTFNCGRCGLKCGHNEICCGGHCVNPSLHSLHCGSCGNSCKEWESCVYGMCSYA